MKDEERDKSVVCPYCVDPQYRHILSNYTNTLVIVRRWGNAVS